MRKERKGCRAKRWMKFGSFEKEKRREEKWVPVSTLARDGVSLLSTVSRPGLSKVYQGKCVIRGSSMLFLLLGPLFSFEL